jgi:hypothetical protein
MFGYYNRYLYLDLTGQSFEIKQFSGGDAEKVYWWDRLRRKDPV